MKNISFKKILLSFGLLFSFVAFNSCIDPNSAVTEDSILSSNIELGDIVGTWESSFGEKFVISSTEFKNYYGDSETYTGNNLYIKKISPTSGYIYFKYTKAFCYTHSDFDPNHTVYVYDTDAPDVGKWYAVYYSDLTAHSVKISGASGDSSSFSTIQEAVNGFIVENNYFDYNSECVKTASGSGTITDVSTVVSTGSTTTGSTGGTTSGTTGGESGETTGGTTGGETGGTTGGTTGGESGETTGGTTGGESGGTTDGNATGESSGSTGGSSSGVVTTSYYVRRSYTDPSDPNYSNTLEDDTYWDVLVYNSANPLEFTEVTYPVQNNQRVREVYTWAKDGDYFYLLDEDDEPVNGALVTISNNSITRKAAIGFDYLDCIDFMFCEEVFELVTDESLIPTAASYDIPATRTLADCVEAGSYCVPGWCNSQTTFSLLLVTEDKKAIWYYYGGGSRNRKEYNLENYSDEGTTIESDGLAVQFSPEVDDDTCQIRFKNSSGTWSSWHLTPYSDCGVIEMMNSQRSSDFLCLTKFGAFGFVRSSRDASWGAKNTAILGSLNACSDNDISTVRITSSNVLVSLWEESDWDEDEEEEVPYGNWSVTENSNITISELFNQLQ